MDLRLAMRQLATQYELNETQYRRLIDLAGIDSEPDGLARKTAFGVAGLGAVLGGLGIIFWVAANWSDFGRAGRFAILQGLVVAMCIGALARPSARVPFSLIAMLGIGGLFAYFGQTYQTGADPWQLFAWWAVLAVPLCMSVRNDILWATFALVGATAITLWVNANTGRSWGVEEGSLPVFLAGWSAALLLAFAFAPAWRRYTGAGPVGMRVAILLAVMMIIVPAMRGLFFYDGIAPHFWIGLGVLCAGFAVFAHCSFYDIFALSSVGLALNIVLVGLFAKLLPSGTGFDFIFGLAILGLVAAALLAFTVSFVLRLSHRVTSWGN